MLPDALEELYDAYPQVIAQMPAMFTSHQFIAKLAQQNQRAYVEALYAYRDKDYRAGSAPFLILHGCLGARLGHCTDLVAKIDYVNSRNIFGDRSNVVRWRKL